MKNMFDVIKYNGDNQTLVYRYPVEDFNTKSQLVVQQSQEAVFYSRGQLADIFPEGSYTLSTKNIPILCNLVNLPFGKESPFSAVIYFVNKTEQININWGIQKVKFTEPNYGVILKVGACGKLTFKVTDSRAFLSKLVAQKTSFTQAEVMEFMQGFITSIGKNHLAKIFNTRTDFDIFTIETQYDTVADALKESLIDDFNDYGLQIEKFFVTSVAIDEESPEYQQLLRFKQQPFDEETIKYQQHMRRVEQMGEIELTRDTSRLVQENDLYLDEQRRLHELKLKQQEQAIQQDLDKRGIMADADAQGYKRNVEGYTYQEERGYGVADKAAENESVGNFSSTGIALGTINATANTVSALYTDALSSINVQGQPQNAEPNVSGFMFTGVGLDDIDVQQSSAPATPNVPTKTKKDRLLELKELFDMKLIEQEDYDARKAEILKEI